MKFIIYIKAKFIPFFKKKAGIKTILFSELQYMHILSTDYGPFCLFGNL